MYESYTQSRKWLLTINNPQDHGMSHDEIIDRAQKFNPDYMCMADEIGESGTYHTHLFLYSSSPMRFGTVKKRFPTAHIDRAHGTVQDNRAYIRKEGKWADTDKSETRVEGTFKEFGELPDEASEKSPKYAKLLQCVKEGMSNKEILAIDPSFAFHLEHIDKLRQDIRFEKYLTENRFIKVHYLWGDSGTGKTRSIFEKHPAEEICRITHYPARGNVQFDAYKGQSVLVFEEFHSEIPISMMLNLLDIYPLMLPARYHDRIACYLTVYITSNIPLEEQYKDIHKDKLETWNAFLRRIHTVTEFRKDGTIREVPHETI